MLLFYNTYVKKFTEVTDWPAPSRLSRSASPIREILRVRRIGDLPEYNTIEVYLPVRRGKRVLVYDVRADHRELETACKHPGRRRHGQVWHQTCPGFGHLDSHPAGDGERNRDEPGTRSSTLGFRYT